MEKEFVPYNLALRMKQLGFDEPCFDYYWHDTDHWRKGTLVMGNITEHTREKCIKAPTFSQAFRFFREKYGLYTELHKMFDGISGSIILSEYRYDHRQDKEVEYHVPKHFGHKYKSYEEAELACLEKLIEIA